MTEFAAYYAITWAVYVTFLIEEYDYYGIRLGLKTMTGMLLLSLLGFIVVPLLVFLIIAEDGCQTKPSQVINRTLAILWGEQ